MNKVSVSQIKRTEMCPMNHILNKIIGFRGSSAFSFGLSYHEGLDNYGENKDLDLAVKVAEEYFGNQSVQEYLFNEYVFKCKKKGEHIDRVFEDFEEQVEDMGLLLRPMLTRYINWLNTNSFEVVDSEIGSIHPISDDLKLDFIIDRVVKQGEKYYLVEDKTAKVMNMNQVQTDLQARTYLSMADKVFDFPIEGLIYTKNIKKVSKEPTILKSGQLSTNKNQGCDPEEYIELAYEMYGDDIPDKVQVCYEYMTEKSPMFAYELLTMNNKEKEFVMNQVVLKGRETAEINNTYNKYKDNEKELLSRIRCNFTEKCFNFCNNFLECLAYQKGE